MRAPKNSMSLPISPVPIRRRLRSVMARMGAEPVPVQIMMRLARGWFGMRKVWPKGPITWTVSFLARSHR
ncbi:hypothetical protein D3C87_2167570 [compost metagenome]